MISDIEKQTIQGAIDREFVRSVVKWGNWDDVKYGYMFGVVNGEIYEVSEALEENDHHSEHGTFNELAQVAACCQKMMMQIMRREGKADE